jgi:hypothetical protein
VIVFLISNPSESKKIEEILSNTEMQVKDYISAGKVVVWDELCFTKSPFYQLDIVEGLENLIIVKYTPICGPLMC